MMIRHDYNGILTISVSDSIVLIKSVANIKVAKEELFVYNVSTCGKGLRLHCRSPDKQGYTVLFITITQLLSKQILRYGYSKESSH